MLFELQKKGLGPSFYLSNDDLRTLWKVRTGKSKKGKITGYTLLSPFFLRPMIDVEDPTEYHELEPGVWKPVLPKKDPISITYDPTLFNWEDRPELIGFYFNGPNVDQIAHIESGFFPVHLLLPVPKEEMARRKKEFLKTVMCSSKKKSKRDFTLKVLHERLIEEGHKPKDSFDILSDLSRQMDKGGIGLEPGSIKKNIVQKRRKKRPKKQR